MEVVRDRDILWPPYVRSVCCPFDAPVCFSGGMIRPFLAILFIGLTPPPPPLPLPNELLIRHLCVAVLKGVGERKTCVTPTETNAQGNGAFSTSKVGGWRLVAVGGWWLAAGLCLVILGGGGVKLAPRDFG